MPTTRTSLPRHAVLLKMVLMIQNSQLALLELEGTRKCHLGRLHEQMLNDFNLINENMLLSNSIMLCVCSFTYIEA